MRSPGYYSDAIPSSRVSPYYVWFKDLGYPTLDIEKYEDGEWSIIQYHVTPIIPSLTPYHHILIGLKNQEINHTFIKKYLEMIDITKRAFWEQEEAKSDAAQVEQIKTDEHRADMVEKAHKAISQNPDLMNRIAKFGIGEIDLFRIAKHIPSYRW